MTSEVVYVNAQEEQQFPLRKIDSDQGNEKPIPGDIAIWVLIFAELFEFGMLFILYVIAKVYEPELFRTGPLSLNTTSGICNTLILLTSSYFVARAVRAIRLGQIPKSKTWLWLTFLSGVAYCLVKAYEYNFNAQNGIDVETNLFFSVYYYLTFNHLLHVGFGMSGLLWVLFRHYNGAYTADNYHGLESAACYWHMVDLAWIILFPLIYVIR